MRALTIGTFRRAWPQVALLLCVGYMLMGKTLAYVGVSSLYIGEFVLLIGIALCIDPKLANPLFRMPLFWILVCFIGWGALRTIPYISGYGLDALRDSVVWSYSLFAILLSCLLIRYQSLIPLLRFYDRHVVIWTACLLVSMTISILFGDRVPTFGPGEVAFLLLKYGDTAVHLSGLATFITLGIGRDLGQRRSRLTSATFYLFWWLTALEVAINNRGALLTIILCLVIPPIFGFVRGVARQGAVGLLAAVLIATLIPALDFSGRGREFSLSQVVTNAESIVMPVDEADLDNTKVWRQMWWTQIVDYTVHGPYFWLGKGYGINLATDDGVITTAGITGPVLRSPHNGHMTFLARSGVPGMCLWILLNLSFAASLIHSFFRARRRGMMLWAHIDLWVLIYWVGFIVNMSVDVFLEGPQGGIPFWCLFGIGMTALHTQKRLFAQARPIAIGSHAPAPPYEYAIRGYDHDPINVLR